MHKFSLHERKIIAEFNLCDRQPNCSTFGIAVVRARGLSLR